MLMIRRWKENWKREEYDGESYEEGGNKKLFSYFENQNEKEEDQKLMWYNNLGGWPDSILIC